MADILIGLGKKGKILWSLAGFVLLLGVSVLDYATGIELSFSLFYLLPVSLFSLVFRRNAGVITAFVCAGIWLFIETRTEIEHSYIVHIWNAIIRLGFFLFPALLLKSWEKQWEYARTDFLTGAFNSRYFNELLQREIDRSTRYNHPFTIAFIDIDNFKAINDSFGHAFGDTVLHSVAQSIMKKLRKTDMVARIGGDEFTILLPETNEETARTIISKLFEKLTAETKEKNYPITFSVGVLTILDTRLTIDRILGITDELMYHAKESGKNNIRYQSYKGE